MKNTSIRGMQYWYGRINRAAFHGMLPKARILFVDSDVFLGQASFDGEYIIKLNRRIQFSRTVCIQTLVHEMVHIHNWTIPHGKKFAKEVTRVYMKARLFDFL